MTASADYEGTGTFAKTTGSLDSGYYVFTYATATTMFPMSNDTSSDKWIKPGPSFTITDTLENPDPSIVWYYDADTGTLNSAGDPTLYVSWPTSGNSAMPFYAGSITGTLWISSGAFFFMMQFCFYQAR